VLAQLPASLQQEVVRGLKPRLQRHQAAASKGGRAGSRTKGGGTLVGVTDEHASIEVVAGIKERAAEGEGGGDYLQVQPSVLRRQAGVADGNINNQQQHPYPPPGQGKHDQSSAPLPPPPCPVLLSQPAAAVRRHFSQFVLERTKDLLQLLLPPSSAAPALPAGPYALHADCDAATARTAGITDCPAAFSAGGSVAAGHHSTVESVAVSRAAGNYSTVEPVAVSRAAGIHGTVEPVAVSGAGEDYSAAPDYNAIDRSGTVDTAAVCAAHAVGLELQGACVRLEGWALALCGNLEETGKTLSTLEGLSGALSGKHTPTLRAVQGVVRSVSAAVHARYGVHLLPM